ncbi:hypothetical protein C0580_01655 [Candidatus Parcubacteria bacterium]|nr:MAG: hypothetical protein C0580_01655 [Candidatus Parcubacteria bacterium]
MIKLNKNQLSFDKARDLRGFTLIELLISVSIFAMVVLMVSGIYLAFSKNQARAKASQTLLNNAQYTLEIMAREIRNSEIYDYNPNNSGGMCGLVSCCEYYMGPDYESCILLKKEDGKLFGFVADLSANTQELYYVVSSGQPYVSIPWESDYAAFTKLLGPDLNEVVVQDLDFYISPSSDPFVEGGPNVHPRVTIDLKAQYNTDQLVAQVSYLLQTTVSSRIYKR